MGFKAHLEIGDIERLPYADASFDTITAACVFCSVGDPVRGLREAARVVRPRGQVLLYEHVRPRNPVLGRLTDLVSPSSGPGRCPWGSTGGAGHWCFRWCRAASVLALAGGD